MAGSGEVQDWTRQPLISNGVIKISFSFREATDEIQHGTVDLHETVKPDWFRYVREVSGVPAVAVEHLDGGEQMSRVVPACDQDDALVEDGERDGGRVTSAIVEACDPGPVSGFECVTVTSIA